MLINNMLQQNSTVYCESALGLMSPVLLQLEDAINFLDC